MNGTMPATVNSRDGSLETREAEGTAVWPLLTKKSIQRLVISCDFITWFLTLQYSLRMWFIHCVWRSRVSAERSGSGLRPGGRAVLGTAIYSILPRLAPDDIPVCDRVFDASVDAEGGAEFGLPLPHADAHGVGEVVDAVGEPSDGPVQAFGADRGLRFGELAECDNADRDADAHPDDSVHVSSCQGAQRLRRPVAGFLRAEKADRTP